jgi:hypothetical protein
MKAGLYNESGALLYRRNRESVCVRETETERERERERDCKLSRLM